MMSRSPRGGAGRREGRGTRLRPLSGRGECRQVYWSVADWARRTPQRETVCQSAAGAAHGYSPREANDRLLKITRYEAPVRCGQRCGADRRHLEGNTSAHTVTAVRQAFQSDDG